MPEGTCDPATRGMAYNEIEQQSGPVTVYGRYGWDGVSERPECDGPVSLVRGTNASEDDTWYVHFQGQSGTWRTVTLAPGETREIVQPELTQLGLADYADLRGLYVSDEADPPMGTFRRK